MEVLFLLKKIKCIHVSDCLTKWCIYVSISAACVSVLDRVAGMLEAEIVPKRRAMLDPVLSDVPPSIDVTLTLFSCMDSKGATRPNDKRNINKFRSGSLSKMEKLTKSQFLIVQKC